MTGRIVRLCAGTAIGLTAMTAMNLRHLRRPDPDAPAIRERVSVLVPARNEERHIERTVRSLLAQDGIADLELIVLDDGSTDRTHAILAAIDDDRLVVISEPDIAPPAGWLGKPWACQRLAARATGTVLVFADADVHFEPHAIRAAIAELRAGDFALVSPYPQQSSQTWLERLVQPLVTWSWIATMPLHWAETSTRPSLSAANGQFLVFDARSYHAIDGHAAVRGNVLEDIGMMRAIKVAGEHAATVDGSHLAQCRMYDDASAVVDGYAKSLWAAFNGPVGSIAVNALLLGAYVVPAGAMIAARERRTRSWGAAGFAAGVTSRALVARRTGERIWPDAVLHPASVVAFATLNAISWSRHIRGTNDWKGRPVWHG